MASQKQIEANRRNAKRSTGPVTELGKAVAKFNALKHGMTADTAVLPFEDPVSYAQLRESLVEHYQPANPAESMLVEVVVNSYWRLLRSRRVETSALRLAIHNLKQRNDINPAPRSDDDAALAAFFTDGDDTLRNMERYHTNIERSYFRAVETLRKVQNDRLREERRLAAAAGKIGFVSQRAVNAQPKQTERTSLSLVPKTSIPVEPEPTTYEVIEILRREEELAGIADDDTGRVY